MAVSQPEFHIITSGKQSPREVVQICSLVHHLVDAIHLRENNWSSRCLYDTILALLSSGVPAEKLVVNDRVDIALLTGVERVQLGSLSVTPSEIKRMFPTIKIGISVHSPAEADAAGKTGADSILLGNIYHTGSKPGKTGIGVGAISKVKDEFPVVGIGGITPDNSAEVIRAGAAGIAVLSGVFLSTDPRGAAEDYRASLKGGGAR
ncbi:thiamine phosphate synthase [Rossellomorea marisflavi]|uniref:thiamine phosphate synthase n=1 Tax=Rossellomorea marisflavi TaxID=189381 RepID=UPI00345C85B5